MLRVHQSRKGANKEGGNKKSKDNQGKDASCRRKPCFQAGVLERVRGQHSWKEARKKEVMINGIRKAGKGKCEAV